MAWTSAVEAVDPARPTTPVLRVVGWRNVNCKMDGGYCGSVHSVYFQRVTQRSAECGRSSELRKSLNFGVVDISVKAEVVIRGSVALRTTEVLFLPVCQ